MENAVVIGIITLTGLVIFFLLGPKESKSSSCDWGHAWDKWSKPCEVLYTKRNRYNDKEVTVVKLQQSRTCARCNQMEYKIVLE